MTPIRPIVATPNKAIGLGSGIGAMPKAPLLAALPTIMSWPAVELKISPKTSTRRAIGEVIVTVPRSAPAATALGKVMSAAACNAVGKLIPFTAPFAIDMTLVGKPVCAVVKKSVEAKVTGEPIALSKLNVMLPRVATSVFVADSTNRTVVAAGALGVPPNNSAPVPLETVNGPSAKVAGSGVP